MTIRAKTDLVSPFTHFLAVLQTPVEEADVVFFTLPVAEVPQEVLLFKKVREAGAKQVSGFRAGTHPALPGCLQPGRAGGSWLVIKVWVIYSKIWV